MIYMKNSQSCPISAIPCTYKWCPWWWFPCDSWLENIKLSNLFKEVFSFLIGTVNTFLHSQNQLTFYVRESITFTLCNHLLKLTAGSEILSKKSPPSLISFHLDYCSSLRLLFLIFMVSQMSTGSATMLKNTFGESSITFQVSGGVYIRVHAQYLCDVFICGIFCCRLMPILSKSNAPILWLY